MSHLPPQASRSDHTIRHHNIEWIDPYHWFRDKSNPKLLKHVDAEDAYCERLLKPIKPLQEEIYNEILSRIKQTDLTVPIRMRDHWYYSRTVQGQQYSIHCRKFQSIDAPEQIMLDENELAKGHDYFDLGGITINRIDQILAYAVDTTGNETYTIYFKDLRTGQIISDSIPNTGSCMVWAEDKDTLFYNTLDDKMRPSTLWKHVLHTPSTQDQKIHHEADEKFFLNIEKSKDKKFILMTLDSKTTSEVHYLNAHDSDSSFRILQPRLPNLEYSVDHAHDQFIILTNHNAKNFKLVTAPDANPQIAHWKDHISHRSDVLIDDFDVFQEYLTIYERKDGLEQIRIQKRDQSEDYLIPMEEAVYSLHGGHNPEFQSTTLRYHYSSLITPHSVYEYDFTAKSKSLLKMQEVLGTYNPQNYTTERLHARSKDGTSIPISIVHRKDFMKNGQAPLLLYGYGAYGITIEPSFSSTRLSLLDRGFTFAIAHVRGGEDLGRGWYEEGKLFNKMNSFTDFIACAEHLIQEKYTSPQKLMISGGSAGGLLMGSVVNLQPELFRAAILHVPFVDVLNTMLDDTLPLTITEYEEWGNPTDKEAFDYIRSYSPYDNIRTQNYPAMLVTGGWNDPRVSYWEPLKWVTKVREHQTGKSPIILKINREAGHQGPSGRYETYKEIALDYAFFLGILEDKI